VFLGESVTEVIVAGLGLLSVYLFRLGAGGLLSDKDSPASKPTSDAGDLRRIREELNQLRKLDVSDLVSEKVKAATEEISKTLELASRPIDLSDPNKIFIASRDRLILDAQRIDRISRRNLYFGIVFSAFALAALAIPLVAQSLNLNLTKFPEGSADKGELFLWFAKTYIPRFAVALLLQFVGFFFLRLYVANELDLKHNKN
jgi:hypothetical protein